MKNIFLSLFVLLTTHTFGQQHPIKGVWRTPSDFSVTTYTFDSLGKATYNQRGCMSRVAFNGSYILHKDTIFIQYDTLSQELQKIYRSNSRTKKTDTLIWINPHKIKIYPYPTVFIYDQSRDEQVLTLKPNGLFTYKVRHFGDTFTIKEFMYNEWKTIDTLINPGEEYINPVDYPLFLHSGLNEFIICANNIRINEISVEAEKPEVKIIKKTVTNLLTFSDTTIYEVQDRYGNKLLSGKGKTIDCRKLEKGKYILKFDNRTEEFSKE